jgi:hypothetical protein
MRAYGNRRNYDLSAKRGAKKPRLERSYKKVERRKNKVRISEVRGG